MGISHNFDDEMIAKLHRDFEKECRRESQDKGPAHGRASVLGRTFSDKNAGGSGEGGSVKSMSCGRLAFGRILALQGFALDTTTRMLFAMFDTDGSGTIDFRELLFGLTMLSSSSNVEQLATRCFNLYDEARSGALSRKQLVGIIQASCKLHGVVLTEADVQKRLAVLFADAADPAHVSLDEFVKGVRAHPDMLALM
jgi:Ca2+-binding EF-hand superfamily protein